MSLLGVVKFRRRPLSFESDGRWKPRNLRCSIACVVRGKQEEEVDGTPFEVGLIQRASNTFGVFCAQEGSHRSVHKTILFIISKHKKQQ